MKFNKENQINKNKAFKLLLPVILTFISLTNFAQTGSIEGTVVDKNTNESLYGVYVTIDGTTIGTITDFEGHFLISDIKPGQYKIKVTLMSYKTSIFENIKIESNKTFFLNATIEDATSEIKEVTVSGVRQTNSEISVISSIKAKTIVASGISAQQISRSQDKDASEVVKRIPGVTILNDRFIVIRGLNQRYSNVWLNNSSSPSSETDIKAFSFDAIPSGMIENIMIYKSVSPELPAEFAGGFINITTKNMPDSSYFAFDYSTGYRTGTTFENFKQYKGGKYDWTGFDDGSRSLPSNFPNNLNTISDNLTLQKYASEFKNNYAINDKKAFLDQKIGFTFARKIKVKKMMVGNMTVLNYSNSKSSYDKQNNSYASYNVISDSLQYNSKYIDDIYSNNVKWTVLHNWSFYLKRGNKIEFRNMFNQTTNKSTTIREGIFYENFRQERSYQQRFINRSTYNSQLGGEHSLNNGNTNVNWNVGYAFANRTEPDRRILISELDQQTKKYRFVIQNSANPNLAGKMYQENKENIVSSGINLEQKFKIFSIVPIVKIGSFSEFKNRSFNARNIGFVTTAGFDPTIESNADLLYLPIEQIFAEQNFTNSGLLSISENTNKSDSYNAQNKLFAAYSTILIPFSKIISISGGLRIEQNEMLLSSYKQDQYNVAVKVDNNKFNFFPSANLTINVSEKNLIRLGYGKSINRPEFREIAPYFFVDFDKNAGFRGTTDLKDADITNIDLRFENYPSKSETFAIAFFYKNFQNPIEIVNSNEGSGKNYVFQNANQARNVGIEFDVRKALAYSGFLQNISVVANASLIQSKVVFAKEDKENTIDRPLQGQSAYIGNIGLFYTNSDNNFMISALYNVAGKRIIAVGIVKQNTTDNIPNEYEMPRNVVDITISKKFGKNFEIKFGIKDLLNEPIKFQQKFEFEKSGVNQTRDGITTMYRPGTYYSLSLSYKI